MNVSNLRVGDWVFWDNKQTVVIGVGFINGDRVITIKRDDGGWIPSEYGYVEDERGIPKRYANTKAWTLVETCHSFSSLSEIPTFPYARKR